MDWTAKLVNVVSSIKVKSAIDPLFKYAIILLIAAVTLSPLVPEWASIVLFITGFIVLMYALFSYDFFRRTNPDYLRSEEFQIKKHSIEILGDKDNMLDAKAEDVVLIANPYYRNLIDEGGK